MMEINLTENRNDIISFSQLRGVENSYTFYYDETNNIRKLRLRPNGNFNIKVEEVHKNFVLAGVVFENKKFFDINKLKESLNIEDKNLELKFKQIAKGTFLECLKSKKLEIFFDWLIDSKLLIHYSSIDILYWSIVDILESTVIYYNQFRYEDLNYFKTLLYELVKVDLESFLKILYKYNYPSITEKRRNKFLSEIMKYIDRNKSKVIDDIAAVDNHAVLVLLDILKNAKNNELAFIENNIELELIDSFNLFYQRPLGLFSSSMHVFDEEIEVMDKFKRFKFLDGSVELNNFVFKESHKDSFIQVSDIIVGILGKYMAFINALKFDDISSVKNGLNTHQRANLEVFFNLLVMSEEKSNAFIHHSAPLTFIEKGRLLCQDIRGK